MDPNTGTAEAPATFPRFANPAALIKAVPLAYPVEYGGKLYATVFLRKMTAGEVRSFVASYAEVRKADPDAVPRFPIFVDENGEQLPIGLLDGLESDDFDTVDEEAVAFLPRRFRSPAATEPSSGSTPSIGGASGPAFSE